MIAVCTARDKLFVMNLYIQYILLSAIECVKSIIRKITLYVRVYFLFTIGKKKL